MILCGFAHIVRISVLRKRVAMVADLSAFAARLREERLRKALNQQDFAALGGVKRTSQIQYEAAKGAPGVDYLYRLAAHGVDVGYVVTGVRDDGSLGLWESQLLDRFRILTEDQRAALVAFLDTLGSRPSPGLPRRPTAHSLHAPATDYRAEEG